MLRTDNNSACCRQTVSAGASNTRGRASNEANLASYVLRTPTHDLLNAQDQPCFGEPALHSTAPLSSQTVHAQPLPPN